MGTATGTKQKFWEGMLGCQNAVVTSIKQHQLSNRHGSSYHLSLPLTLSLSTEKNKINFGTTSNSNRKQVEAIQSILKSLGRISRKQN